jgi:hypothetical protein
MPRSTPPSAPVEHAGTDHAAAPVASSPAPADLTPPADRVYVDGIEGELARLLIVDAQGEWRPYHLPLRVLPSGLKENTWISLHSAPQPEPPWAERVRGLRARLGRDDDGSDFSL